MLISILKYAQKHGVSTQTIYNNINWGFLKTAQKIEGKWKIDEDEPYPEHPRKKKEKKPREKVEKKVEWLPAPTDGYILLSEYATKCGVSVNIARQAAQRGEIPGAIQLHNGWMIGSGPTPVSATAYAKLHGLSTNTVIVNLRKGKLPGYRIGDLNFVDSPEDSQYIEIISGMRKRQSIVGETFGYLKVLKDYGNDRLLCKCKCGRTVEVAKSAVAGGNTRSCGCLRREILGKGTNGIYLNLGSYKYQRYVYDRIVYFGAFASLEEAQKVRAQVEEIISQYDSSLEALDLCLKIKAERVNNNEWLRRKRSKTVLLTPEEIKRICTLSGMTRKEIAEFLGVSMSALFMWLNGSMHPRGEHLNKLLELKNELDSKPPVERQEPPPEEIKENPVEEEPLTKEELMELKEASKPYSDGEEGEWPPPPSDGYITLSEYATKCGVSIGMALNAVKQGEIQGAVHKGRGWIVGTGDIPVSVSEYAGLHGIAQATVLWRIKNGNLSGYRIGKSWYISSDVPLTKELETIHPEEIKMIRRTLNMNTAQFADLIGVLNSQISRWEKGTAKPMRKNRDKLLEIKKALNQCASNQEIAELCLQIKAGAGGTKIEKKGTRRPKGEKRGEITPKDIKTIRETLNLSTRKFAKALGVNQLTVLNWEQGRHLPLKESLDKLLKLKQEGHNADPV